MRPLKIILTLVFLVFLAGCRPVVSLQPFYFDEDVVFDEALLGTWEITEEGSTDRWIFKRTGLDSYEMLMKGDGDEPMLFSARAFELEGVFFLDVYPKEEKEGKSFRFDLVPAHTLMRYEVKDDNLYLSMLDETWLDKNFDEGKFTIAYSRLAPEGSYSKGDIILTASTQELQDFITTYVLQDEEAFGSSSDEPLNRRK